MGVSTKISSMNLNILCEMTECNGCIYQELFYEPEHDMCDNIKGNTRCIFISNAVNIIFMVLVFLT